MGSNLWPIATVFWLAVSILPACGIGAMVGWIMRRTPREVAITAAFASAAIISFVLVVLMVNS